MSPDPFDRYATLDPARSPQATPDWTTAAPVLRTALDERTTPMQTNDILGVSDEPRARPKVVMIAIAAIMVVIVAGAVLAITFRASESQPAGPADDPAAVVHAFIAAYNANDIDAAAALFAEDAVIDDPRGGLLADISNPAMRRAALSVDRDRAFGVDPWEIYNIEVAGATVTWESAFTFANGTTFCSEGFRAVIEGGMIVSLSYPRDAASCKGDPLSDQ